MREWQRNLDELHEVGATLHVLTSDSPGQIAADMVDKNLIIAPMAAVDVSLWAEWGVSNPGRPELPRPTTYVVAPNGELIWAKTTPDYSERISAAKVVKLIADHRAGRPVEAARVRDEGTPIDWGAAVQVKAVRALSGTDLFVTVAPDFHVYGKREKSAMPLEVWVDGAPVKTRLPRGPDVEGRFVLPLKDGPGAGTLRYQACTGSICSPPSELAWSVE